MSRFTAPLKRRVAVLLRRREEKFLEKVYRRELAGNPRVERILVGNFDPALEGLAEGRNFPDKERHKEKDWWKTMLLRYGLARKFSKGKRVLDTCSGLGWGIYLVEEKAASVTGVELEFRASAFAMRHWSASRAHWVTGSVLDMPLRDGSVDLALAFESIEHFSLPDIKTYIGELYRVCRPGGRLIGSSYFPDTRQEAERVCAQKVHHLHICTRDEIRGFLYDAGFKKTKVFSNRIFFWALK